MSSVSVTTLIGDRLYVTGSLALHGKNPKRDRWERHQFLQMDLEESDGRLRAVNLAHVTGRWPNFRDWLISKSGYEWTAEEVRGRAEGDGINVEALSATSDGNLLIGFRGPLTADGGTLALEIKLPPTADDEPVLVKAHVLTPVDRPHIPKGAAKTLRAISMVPGEPGQFYVLLGPKGYEKEELVLAQWNAKTGKLLIKYWFDVGMDEQERRFRSRDEDSQFMNPAFATPDNRPGAPSYDPGAAFEFVGDPWSLKGVYMRTSTENIEDVDYFAIQAGYHRLAANAPGNYRIVAYSAAGRLKEPKGQPADVRMHGLGISIDQKLGEDWGIFFRAFVQKDKAPVVYDRDVSGGISINGRRWGRPDDVLGIAYAYLMGSTQAKIDHSHVAEAYLKFQLPRDVDITFDVQYVTDRIDSPRRSPQAWIIGGRLNFLF